jgi:hypothetical protein
LLRADDGAAGPGILAILTVSPTTPSRFLRADVAAGKNHLHISYVGIRRTNRTVEGSVPHLVVVTAALLCVICAVLE